VLTVGASLFAIILSLISTAISVFSFRRSRRTQEYEYATRLQIADEKTVVNSSAENILTYSAQLLNLGLKPVRIVTFMLTTGVNSSMPHGIMLSKGCPTSHQAGAAHCIPSSKEGLRGNPTEVRHRRVFRPSSHRVLQHERRHCRSRATTYPPRAGKNNVLLPTGRCTDLAEARSIARLAVLPLRLFRERAASADRLWPGWLPLPRSTFQSDIGKMKYGRRIHLRR
jgi:cbb3-type cytochrome oxidase subunit 3